MISDYLKKYSTYYLSRYTVTQKKFEDILKKKITKDFLEKKISETQFLQYETQISLVVKYFKKIGFFNEKNMLEVLFENLVGKGYSKKKIKFKILSAKYDTQISSEFLNEKFNDNKLNKTLLENYLKKSKVLEKQKKLNISDKQLFGNILKKLAGQGFDYEDSIKILKDIIPNGDI